MTYVDSSVLLEVYLGQPRAAEASALLASDPVLVASWLLAVEVSVALRRAFPSAGPALDRALARFDRDLAAISLIDALPEAARRIRQDARFSLCRALDAIHVATATFVRDSTAVAVRMATFDRRLADAARDFGFAVVGA